jgi:hypothetical protein
VNNKFNLLFCQITAGGEKYGCFQQDNATAHTTESSRDATCDVFDDKIISKG